MPAPAGRVPGTFEFGGVGLTSACALTEGVEENMEVPGVDIAGLGALAGVVC